MKKAVSLTLAVTSVFAVVGVAYVGANRSTEPEFKVEVHEVNAEPLCDSNRKTNCSISAIDWDELRLGKLNNGMPPSTRQD